MCTIFSSSWLCCCSKTLVSSAKSTVTLMSEPVVKSHNWPKMGSRSDARKSKSWPCQSLDYPRVPARAPPPTSPPQESSTSWNPASSRSNKEARGNWRKEAACRVFANGWWTSQSTSRRRSASSRKHFSRLRSGASYDKLHQGSTVFTPRQTKKCEVCKRTNISRAFRRRRTGDSVPRAKKVGDLITADHKVPNKMWIFKTINDTRSVYKMKLLKGLSRTRAKQELFWRRKEFLRKFLELSEKARSHFTNSSFEFGKVFGRIIMESSYFNNPSVQDERVCWESSMNSKGTAAALCNLVCVNIVYRFDGMLLLSLKRSRSLGRCEDPFGKDDSENHSEARYIQLEQWLNILRFWKKPVKAPPNVGKKVLPGAIFGNALVAAGNLAGKFSLQTSRSWEKLDASEVHARRINEKEVFTLQKGEHLPNCSWNSKIVWKRSWSPWICFNLGWTLSWVKF